MTPDERLVFARLVGALASTFTKSGHVAQRVDSEHLGYCSWRGCAPKCQRDRDLFLEASDVLEAALTGVERVEQGALFDEVAG